MTAEPEMNVARFLEKSAIRFPDLTAIRYGTASYPYREFYRRACSLGGELRARGLRHGDRVAFALHNSPAVLETIFGCFVAGLVVVPMNARLHAKEMGYIVRTSGARVLIHGAAFSAEITRQIDDFGSLDGRFEVDATLQAETSDGPMVESYGALIDSQRPLDGPVEITGDDAAWLFYTSGTTGRPKGAIWTHRTIRVVVMNYLADVYNSTEDDVVLHAAPLSHGSGIVALPAVARGATNVILEATSFSPEILFETVEQQRISQIAFLAPTQIVALLDKYEPDRFDLTSLRMVCYGGAPIYVEQLKAAMSAFGPVFAQIYGQGEAPITITGLTREMHAHFADTDDPRLGSAGPARTDVEVRIVDADGNALAPGQPGEIAARGDVVMRGYWADHEATEATIRDGWLHTGDIGTLDERGYLYLLDRTKDTIITGGNNVYPREVEEILIAHPGVAEVVVFGIPDAYWGEAVHAVVVRQPDSEVSERDLIDYCAESLAGYKKPKAVEFVDTLPVSDYGKVLRRQVRERYWSGRDRKIGGGTRPERIPVS